jgi:nitroimidazol reductase NimA-like FMN-containing flavoprotein (pyridoxamine 5'-phosphate oxidase superfamily)
VCVTITLADGLVLARSVFEHAVNYRSAMIHGYPRVVTDPAEILDGLRLLSEHMAPGQCTDPADGSSSSDWQLTDGNVERGGGSGLMV